MKMNNGFSIVEMMILVLVSGVLTAIAVPIESNNATNAKISEADVSLHNIRTQLRVHYNKTNSYPILAPGSHVVGASWHDIAEGDMTGKYFSDSAYTIESTPSSFTLTCDAENILTSNRTMSQSGVLSGGL